MDFRFQFGSVQFGSVVAAFVVVLLCHRGRHNCLLLSKYFLLLLTQSGLTKPLTQLQLSIVNGAMNHLVVVIVIIIILLLLLWLLLLITFVFVYCFELDIEFWF